MKKFLFAACLLASSLQAGTNAEYADWVHWIHSRGCDPAEYEELYQDCVAIKHILHRMLKNEPDIELLAQHIKGYLLESVGTITANSLYEDIKNIQFDI